MHVCTDGSMHVCMSRGGPACLLRKRSVSRERSDVCKCMCAQGGSMHVCTSRGAPACLREREGEREKTERL